MTAGVWRRRLRLLVAVAAMAPWACMNATDVELLQIAGSAVVSGGVYLDLDGTGTLTTGDQPLVGAKVVLVANMTDAVVGSDIADSLGLFVIHDVPLGAYRLMLDSSTVGDSLETIVPPSPLDLAFGDSAFATLGASYPALSLSEALAAPPGRQIFTSGIALNTRQNFGDGQVHFREGDSVFLRALDVERGPLQAGDSARIRGRVVVDNGRPALEDVTPYVLVPSASVNTPIVVTLQEAATAGGGPLDAALVQVGPAELTDTSTVDGHFRFWAYAGADSVEVVIRDFLLPGINTSLIRPDTVVRIQQLVGLLSPVAEGGGGVRWQVWPRGSSDITLQVKQADVSVAGAFVPPVGAPGDTVQVRVIVSNAGPRTATSVRVRDTIPTGAAFVSATETKGVYAPGTGVWDVGTLSPGEADTLDLELEVTLASDGTVTNVAERLALVLEVDPVGGNNRVVHTLTVSTTGPF